MIYNELKPVNRLHQSELAPDVAYHEIGETLHKPRPGAGIVTIHHAVLETDYDRHFTTYNFASYGSGKNPIDFNQENVSALSLHGRQRGANADNADMTCKGSAGNIIDITKNYPLGSFQRPLTVGVDAEWWVKDENDKNRKILTHQFGFRAENGVTYYAVVDYADIAGCRVSLTSVLGYLMEDWMALGVISRDSLLPKSDIKDHRDAWKAHEKGDGDKPKPLPSLHMQLVAHYGIVDLTAFYDGKKILRSTDTVRKTQVTLQKPYRRTVWTWNRNYAVPLSIHIRDTKLLAPAGAQSLEALGNALDTPKLKLPEGWIEKMNFTRAQHYHDYFCYALQDVRITLDWGAKIAEGDNLRLPITLGSKAASLFAKAVQEIRGWNKQEFDLLWRGIHTTKTGTGKHTVTRKELIAESVAVQSAAMAAFFGGHNEAYLYGIHHAKDGWFDFDLAGAYPTAMCFVKDIDWNATPGVLTGRLVRGQVRPDMVTFPYVRFKFPEQTLYPCLPVKDTKGRGLIYPLEGKTYAGAPELYLALELGAEIEVITPTPIMQTTGVYSTRDGIKALVEARIEARRRYGKGSPEELMFKEMANSVYGKFAQGLLKKRGYNTRTDDYSDTPDSNVTNPYAAALITGWVRAMVGAAIAELGRLGYRIASVTTDGFLTDAPFEVLDKLELFGFRKAFADARDFLVGDRTVWELKHMAYTLVIARTRAGFGIGMLDGAKLPIAKGSYRPTDDIMLIVKSDEAAGIDPVESLNGLLVEMFINRSSSHIPFTTKSLPAPIDYVRKGADAIAKITKRSANWDYDHKRRLLDGWMETVEIKGVPYEHVSAYTLPWQDMDAFDNARAVTESTNKAIKTVGDLSELNSRISFRANAPADVRVSRHGIEHTHAVHIVRAVRQGILKGVKNTGKGSGRAFLNLLEQHYGIGLTDDVWTRAKSGKVVLDGLDDDIAALGLRYAKDDLVITVDSSKVA